MTPINFGAQKSAHWISPRISQRTLFFGHRLKPCSVNIPPEINSKHVVRLFEGWYFEKPLLTQNELRLPECQGMERNL